MRNFKSNFYTDIKESILKYFSFLKGYGFSDFIENQFAYELHFEAENKFVKIDIWFEMTFSSAIWITINGLYADYIELENKEVKNYSNSLKENYDTLFQKYLKTNKSKYLNEIYHVYSVVGKNNNDNYLKEISQILERHSYILTGNLEQLKINSEIINQKREEQKQKEKIEHKVYTLEFDLWDAGEYDLYNEFTSIEEIKKYLKENLDIKKYRILDCYMNEIEIN